MHLKDRLIIRAEQVRVVAAVYAHEWMVERSRDTITTALGQEPGVWRTRDDLTEPTFDKALLRKVKDRALTRLVDEYVVTSVPYEILEDNAFVGVPNGAPQFKQRHDHLRDSLKEIFANEIRMSYGMDLDIDVDDIEPSRDFAGILDQWQEMANKAGVIACNPQRLGMYRLSDQHYPHFAEKRRDNSNFLSVVENAG